ncbi:MAG: amino acid permease [Streptosporangiales bacterium]|nr:amino acid permease [Streptosporangiales bacterium]
MATPTVSRSVLRRKPIDAMARETGADDASKGTLRRSIGLFQLTMFGVGSTVGTGIFFVLGQAVPEAGPAVILSFVLAGVTAGLTALCYAELASIIPVSGSSYSYAYATLGEIVAFGVGACLLLEYGVACAAVAVGWSEYLNSLLGDTVGVTIPTALSFAPSAGGVINLPAVFLVAMCALLLIRGTSESARVNTVMVIIKVAVLLMFVAIAFTGFRSGNLSNFAPFGVAGVGVAAGSIFFSFIGLDAVSTAGEEVRDPRRTLPMAIVLALVIVTAVYILVAVSAVGAQPWERFEGQEAGLAAILRDVTGAGWPAVILAAGAVVSIFGITLVSLYGQTRILFAMGRDGMLPPVFSRVDARTLTPIQNTIIVAIVVAILAGLVPLDYLADLTSVGTLAAFTVVAVGVMILRRTSPHLPRGFRVPGYPVTPVLAVAACLYLISGLDRITLVAFAIWLAVAMVYYVTYARRHSRLAQPTDEATP